MKQRNLTCGSLVAPNSLELVSTPDDGVRVLGTVMCLLYAPSCEASEKPAPYREFKELVKNKTGSSPQCHWSTMRTLNTLHTGCHNFLNKKNSQNPEFIKDT